MSKVDVPVEGKARARLERVGTWYGIGAAFLIVGGLILMPFASAIVGAVIMAGGFVCALLSGGYRLVSDVLAVQDERELDGF